MRTSHPIPCMKKLRFLSGATLGPCPPQPSWWMGGGGGNLVQPAMSSGWAVWSQRCHENMKIRNTCGGGGLQYGELIGYPKRKDYKGATKQNPPWLSEHLPRQHDKMSTLHKVLNWIVTNLTHTIFQYHQHGRHPYLPPNPLPLHSFPLPKCIYHMARIIVSSSWTI